MIQPEDYMISMDLTNGFHYIKVPSSNTQGPTLVQSDNMVTVSYINKMTGWKRSLALVARAIHNFCWKHNITILAVHIPGLQNNIADMLSCWTNNYDWGLSPQVFSALDVEWGPHTVDRFTGFKNHLAKLRREQATATVIAPLWPAQSWFWELLSMSSSPPAMISNRLESYTRGVSSRIEPLRNPWWRLAAFRVHGHSSKQMEPRSSRPH